MRKIYIAILLSIIISESLAASQRFVLKHDESGTAYFELDTTDEFSIYANSEASGIGLPTKIIVTKSENLKNHKLLWPKPKHKYIDGIGTVFYYQGIVKVPIEVEVYDKNKPAYIETELEYALCSDQCIPVKQTVSGQIKPANSKTRTGIKTYGWLVALSIVGGFILNFMPCVLPVLSLKIFSFLKNREIDTKAACSLTIAGIFSSFLALSFLMIALKSSGKQFGLGVNFQVPEFIIFLILLITAFASSASGRFNISLPAKFLDKLHAISPASKYIEHYFSGVLATILSTPCSAPFLGSAVAFAFVADNFHIILTFTSIALGFSAPYILMILYPPILSILPKPGKWMNKLKKILVVLMVATIFWLLFVLNSQIGTRGTLGLFMLLILFNASFELGNHNSCNCSREVMEGLSSDNW